MKEDVEYYNSENNKLLKAIKNYIDNKITDVLIYEDAIREFSKLINFLNVLNYSGDLDALILENRKVENIVKIIVYENYELIKKGKTGELFKDNISISLIENYCILNNIYISTAGYETNTSTSYINFIDKIPLLPENVKNELFIEYKNGDETAKDKLIKSNLRLVISIAKTYTNKCKMEFMDIVQEGNRGLIKAVENYDINKNSRFSTYAFTIIRRHINRAIMKYDRIVRIPEYLLREMRVYYSKKEILEQNAGRELSYSELANMFNISTDKVREYETLRNDAKSLNTVIFEGEHHDDQELEEFIPSDALTVEERFETKIFSEEVSKLLLNSNLTNNEKKVVVYRYGMNKKLAEIGKILNITHQRVKQIETSALDKLRNNNATKSLAVYLNNEEKALNNLKELKKIKNPKK